MKKNDIIRKLQSDLHHIEKFSDDTIRRTKSEADKQQAADQKNSEGKCIRLQQELQGLETSLANAIAEHRDSEADLRKVIPRPMFLVKNVLRRIIVFYKF